MNLALPQWIRFGNKQTLLIFAATVFAVLVLGWNIFLKADLNKIAGLGNSQKDYASRLAVLKEIAASEKKMTMFKDFLAPSSEAPWFMTVVAQIADEAGVSLSTVDPQNPKRDVDDYDKIVLQIQMQCGYHELGEFAARLESYPKVLRLSSVQMKRAGSGENGKTPLDISINLDGYALAKSSS